MRLEEMYSYNKQDLNEGPYGIGSKMKDTVLGALGSYEAQGNREAGEKANQWMKEFKHYIGRVMGRGQKTVPASHLIDFISDKGIDVSKLDVNPNDTINPKQAEKLMFDAARFAFMKNVQKMQQDQVSRGQTRSSSREEPVDSQATPKASRVDKLIAAVNSLSDQELQEFLSKL